MSVKPFVHAVVVTQGLTPYVKQTIEKVRTQTVAPDYVTLVDISGSADSFLSSYCLAQNWTYLLAAHANNLGAAVNFAISQARISAGDSTPQWIWLLHDDSAPQTDCLQALLDRLELVKTAGVVGCKQRDWNKPQNLLELGIKATRSGQRYNHMYNELDQGQYDHTEDVLAVSTAGMLVLESLWIQLEGTDPHLVAFGESLEFGRRAHLAGWRVVVEPKAVILHAQASFHGLRQGQSEPNPISTYSRRRAAQLYNWALAVQGWQLPLLILWLPFLQILKSVFRLFTRSWVLVGQELWVVVNIFTSLGAIARGRRRIRRTAQLKSSTLKRLEVSSFVLLKYKWIDRRARQAAKPVEMLEPVANAGLKVRKERSYLGLAIVMLVALTVSFSFWGARLAGIVGGAYLTLPAEFSALWQYAWTAWVPQGLGAEAPADPLLAVFALLLTPFSLFGFSAPEALRFVLFISPVLASFGAWFAVGTFTRAIPLRLWGALAWISFPAYWLSVAQGRVSVIFFASAAPYVVWGFMRGGLLHKPEIITSATGDLVVRSVTHRTRFLALASFSLLICVAAQPIFLAAAWVVALAGIIVFPSRRFSALFLAVPATIQVLPLYIYAYRQHAIQATLGGIDKPIVSEVPSSRQLLLGWPQDWNSLHLWAPWWVWTIPFILTVIMALLVILRMGRRGWLVRALWIVVLGLLGAGLYVRNIAVAALGQVVNAWPGILLLTVSGLLIVIVCAGFDRAWVLRPRHFAFVLPVILVATTVTLAVGTSLVAPVLSAYAFGRSEFATKAGHHYAIPASAEDSSQSSRRARVLVLDATKNGGLHAHIWRHAGATYAEHNALLDVLDAHQRTQKELPELSDTLSRELGRLRAGRPSKQLAQVLADYAIEQVVLTEWESLPGRNLKSQLSGVEGLESIGATEPGLTWRVAAPEVATDAGAIALRAYISTSQKRYLVPSQPLAINALLDSETNGVLTIVESPSSGWKANLDGQNLKSKSAELQQFEITTGKHLLVTWSRPWLLWWRIACVAAYLFLLSGFIFSHRGGNDERT